MVIAAVLCRKIVLQIRIFLSLIANVLKGNVLGLDVILSRYQRIEFFLESTCRTCTLHPGHFDDHKHPQVGVRLLTLEG
jgi:hypothetical protein